MPPNSHYKSGPSSSNLDLNVSETVGTKSVRMSSLQNYQSPTVTSPSDAGSVDEPQETMNEPLDTIDKLIDTMDKPPDTIYKLLDAMDGPPDTTDEPPDTMDEPSDTIGMLSDTIGRLSATIGRLSDAILLQYVGTGVKYTPIGSGPFDKRKELGVVGHRLVKKLEDVTGWPSDRLRDYLISTGIGIQYDGLGGLSPVTSIFHVMHSVWDIIALSHYCAEESNNVTEWNNRVHSKVLDLALGSSDAKVGYRCIKSEKFALISKPTLLHGSGSVKTPDYAMFFKPSGSALDAISRLADNPAKSINHISYESLRTRPIAIPIETQTESRTVEDAKVQLGLWLAAHVAHIEMLIQGIATTKYGSDNGTSQCSTQQPIPAPNSDNFHAIITKFIALPVYPLIHVQSGSWSLFLGRATMPPDPPPTLLPDGRKPNSRIEIFHSIDLGNTMTLEGTYRLILNLRELKAWVDEDFRKWWDDMLSL